MARRSFLRQLVALPLTGVATSLGRGSSHKSLNIMMKSAWGLMIRPRQHFLFSRSRIF
jgi:hypothetical protein